MSGDNTKEFVLVDTQYICPYIFCVIILYEKVSEAVDDTKERREVNNLKIAPEYNNKQLDACRCYAATMGNAIVER